jgi:phosphoribosyl 1,2-cyclic phosphodiesterase
LLIDCGITLRRLTAALARRGCTPQQLDAVFITHEHSDHVGGVFTLQRRHGTALWASRGTCKAAALPSCTQIACDGDTFTIGALRLAPFAVPHDAAEPLQLVCSAGKARLGVVTDLGEPDATVVQALQGCDALLLECNHDRAMLSQGPYPAWLKRRIGGARGHLANDQSAALLASCRHDGLRHVVAAHLSRHNNAPTLAIEALRSALPAAAPALHVADDHGSAWIDVG